MLTIEHFREMIEFEKFVYNISLPLTPEFGSGQTDGEVLVSFYDLCRKEEAPNIFGDYSACIIDEVEEANDSGTESESN